MPNFSKAPNFILLIVKQTEATKKVHSLFVTLALWGKYVWMTQSHRQSTFVKVRTIGLLFGPV